MLNPLYDTDLGDALHQDDFDLRNDQYSQLKRIANGLIRREMTSTLTATGLVHEWFLKTARERLRNSVATEEFSKTSQFRYAPRKMKQILIDRARSRISRKNSEKNSSHSLVDESSLQKMHEAEQFVIALEEAVQLMEESMPENAQLMRLRVFDGKSIEEAAEMLGMARATAFRKWSFCKVWLASRIDRPA